MDRLQIPQMITHNSSRLGTAFTVSIEAKDGVSTGISAADRAHTCRVAVDEKLTEAKVERNGELGFEAGALTLAEYMDRWLRESARDRLWSKTYKDYKGLTQVHIVPALGHVKLKKLTPLHVQQIYGAKLESALSKRTVEYLHAVLHSALKQAVRWELVPRNVTEAVDPLRPERKERPTLNLDQARLFLESARDDSWEALYVLVIQTGMRRGELFGLKWEDVGLDNGWLHVRQALQRIAV